MTLRRAFGVAAVILVATGAPQRAHAQSTDPAIELAVEAGRPLQIAIDQRIAVKRVGQVITGTLVEPIFAYDRIVVPAGTRVVGHLARLDRPSKAVRIRALLNGDLTPSRHTVVEFDSFVFDDGHTMAILTIVTGTVSHLQRSVAAKSAETEPSGRVARAREKAVEKTRDAVAGAKQQARDALSAVTRPGKMDRLREAVLQRLPYHPQIIPKGTVYQAELTGPIDFGQAMPTPFASAGTLPAAEGILNARLATTLDSANTPRGTSIEAVLTEPVFSSDHQLILPEGTTITGEVTLARQARRFHRNGQLRFLFESVQAPHQEATQLLASLYSVQANAGDHVAVDDEGGTTLTNPKTRFIAPVLALLTLRATTGHEHHRFDNDGDANDVAGRTVQSGNPGSRAIGGFFGLGALGIGLSQLSKPVGMALAVIGVARTLYTNVLGKGKDVRFPADTSIQLQLAPGPAPAP